MKKNVLPKEFQGMLKELKRLDDQLGISHKPYEDKKEVQKRNKIKQREQILEKIWENFPRKTFLNKDVLQMRGNALKNREVMAILGKYRKKIEDCALIESNDERARGSIYEDPCPAFSAPESILDHLQKWKFGNVWKTWFDYYWGGPKDEVKILFQRSGNNRFKVIGLIEIFPHKEAA